MSTLIERLREIGNTQAGVLRTENDVLWHPANLLLHAAERMEELEEALRDSVQADIPLKVRIAELELAVRMKPKPIYADDLKGRITELEAQNKVLRDLLRCVETNLSKGMSKSIQKLQAKTISEELRYMK